MSENLKRPTLFYGWFVVAACFAATFTLGEAMWSFGVFFKPLEQDFGWSRALVSSGYTTFLFGYAISVIISGRMADRYSPRPILFISALLAGIGFLLCSQIHNINEFRLFLFIGGLGGGATISVPTSVVQRWFFGKPRAGLALGIVVAGVGAGALFFSPLVNYLIQGFGWRKTYVIVGLIFFFTITLSSLLIRRAPAIRGTGLENKKVTKNQKLTQGLTTGQILVNPSYIGITFVHLSAVFAFHTISVHLVPHATDMGVSPTAAAVALGLMGGFSVPGRIISGFVADWFGWQKILAISSFGMALFIALLFFVKTALLLYCFAFFYGIAHGSRVAAYVGILGEFFGMRSLGEIIGITTSVAQISSAFAPYLAGFIFDITGSYYGDFGFVMLFLALSGMIAIVIKKPS